jgi:O-antigen ligase
VSVLRSAGHPGLDARQRTIVAAALLLAAITGPLLAVKPIAAVGLAAAVVLVPLAFANPVVALSGWVTLVFLSGVPGTHGAGANYALLIVLIAWIGALVAKRTNATRYVRDHPVQAACVAGIVLWPALTLLWAPNPGVARSTLLNLAICATVFLMVATLPSRISHVRWLALGFVVGTTLSVLVGAASGGLQASDGFDTAASEAGRLVGAGQDANYLAAAIVPAIVLAAGLAVRRGDPLLRLGLAVAVAIMGVGLAATESRGGFLAAIVVCAGALVLLRGQRAQVLAFILVVAVGVGGWFAVSPGSWQRVSTFSDGGSGRTDIWTIALHVAEDHPIVGAGLGQFPVVSPNYLDRPGAIARGDLLVAKRIVVHNLYLQAWAETGIVGLLLYLTIVAASLAAAYRAARRFELAGDGASTALARAALLAVTGALTASFFLSNLDDRRTWVLLALGPALLLQTRTVSRRPIAP